MGGAYGLQTHIWNNNWKTVLLMAGFPVLLLLLTYALFMLYAGFTGTYYGNDPTIGYFIWAGDALARAWPFAIAGAILWFGIAYAFYQNIIDAATGARKVERIAEPKLYNFSIRETMIADTVTATPARAATRIDSANIAARVIRMWVFIRGPNWGGLPVRVFTTTAPSTSA